MRFDPSTVSRVKVGDWGYLWPIIHFRDRVRDSKMTSKSLFVFSLNINSISKMDIGSTHAQKHPLLVCLELCSVCAVSKFDFGFVWTQYVLV